MLADSAPDSWHCTWDPIVFAAPSLSPLLQQFGDTAEHGLNPTAPEFVPGLLDVLECHSCGCGSIGIGGGPICDLPQNAELTLPDYISSTGGYVGDGGQFVSALREVRERELHAIKRLQRAWKRHLHHRGLVCGISRTFRDAALAWPDVSQSKALSGRLRERRSANSDQAVDAGRQVANQQWRANRVDPERPNSKYSSGSMVNKLTTKARIALLGKEHNGVLMEGTEASGNKWIKSSEVWNLIGDTVRVSKKLVDASRLQVGENVLFHIDLGCNMRPFARNVRAACKATSKRSRSHVSFSSEGDHGSIEGGSEVFAHSRHDGATASNTVPAPAKTCKKQVTLGNTCDDAEANVSHEHFLTYEELVAQVHEGEVMECFLERGHGFLRNQRVARLLGKDVYFRVADFPQARSVGDRVVFRVGYDRNGKPRARAAGHSSTGSKLPVQRQQPSPSALLDVSEELKPACEELLHREQEGVVKEFYAKLGHGFLRSEAVFLACGHDVFFRKDQLPRCIPGTAVKFLVEFDAAKRPRVRDRRECSVPSNCTDVELPLSLQECLDSVHDGTVVDFDPALARGFLRNRRIHRLFGKDVLFHKGQFPGVAMGDAVRFGVELDHDGRPRALDPTEVLQEHPTFETGGDRATDAVLASTIASLTWETLVADWHNGVVYQFSDARGYGFVRNAAIHRFCGRDVYIGAAHFAGFQVGDNITFRVELTGDRLPRICEVRSLFEGTSGAEMTVPTMLAREHEGVIAEYDESRGIGFLHNNAVHKLCGKDVLFRRGEFPCKQIGDVVTFRVSLDAVGRPRTVEAADHARKLETMLAETDGGSKDLSMEALLEKAHLGFVKEYYVDKAYGFIASRQVNELLGKDIFFNSRSGERFLVGDQVRFCVDLDQAGRLKARILRREGKDSESTSAGRHFRGVGAGSPLQASNCRAQSTPPMGASCSEPPMSNMHRIKAAMKLLVPDGLTAALIGRRGAGIAELQHKSGAKLSFTTRGHRYPGTNSRVMTAIAGTESSLRELLELAITAMVTHIESNKAVPSMSSLPPEKVKGCHLQIQILVPAFALNDVFGEDGDGLRQLCNEMDCIATLGRECVGDGSSEEQVLTLNGDVAALRKSVVWVSHRLHLSSSKPWFDEWASCNHTVASPLTETSLSRDTESATLALHSAGPEAGKGNAEFNVVLGSDFGPLGLRFQAGNCPAIESILNDARLFWEERHGLQVGDCLLRVNGRLVAGRSPKDVLHELSQRPVLLTFCRMLDGEGCPRSDGGRDTACDDSPWTTGKDDGVSEHVVRWNGGCWERESCAASWNRGDAWYGSSSANCWSSAGWSSGKWGGAVWSHWHGWTSPDPAGSSAAPAPDGLVESNATLWDEQLQPK